MPTSTDDGHEDSDDFDPDEAETTVSAAVADSLASDPPADTNTDTGTVHVDPAVVINLAHIWKEITQTRSSQAPSPNRLCRKRLRVQSPQRLACEHGPDGNITNAPSSQSSPPKGSYRKRLRAENAQHATAGEPTETKCALSNFVATSTATD